MILTTLYSAIIIIIYSSTLAATSAGAALIIMMSFVLHTHIHTMGPISIHKLMITIIIVTLSRGLG